MKHPNVVHEDDMSWSEATHGKFRYKRKLIGQEAGSARLGCSFYEVAPNSSAWPAHFHYANEEAIYILDGAGTLRLGDAEVPVRKGHFIALPSGAGHSHRLVNTSAAPLRYLCVSTMIEPDVVMYPDSKKVGVGVGPRGKRIYAGVFRLGSEVDYFTGEPDAGEKS